MTDRDNGQALTELQAARSEIKRLRDLADRYLARSFVLSAKLEDYDDLYRLVLENTGKEIDGETYWPAWLVDHLKKKGLWVGNERNQGGSDR